MIRCVIQSDTMLFIFEFPFFSVTNQDKVFVYPCDKRLRLVIEVWKVFDDVILPFHLWWFDSHCEICELHFQVIGNPPMRRIRQYFSSYIRLFVSKICVNLNEMICVLYFSQRLSFRLLRKHWMTTKTTRRRWTGGQGITKRVKTKKEKKMSAKWEKQE